MLIHWRSVRKIVLRSIRELTDNDPLRLAGATAFFTTFALPAILIIMLQILQLVLDPRESTRALFDKLSMIVGPASSRQVSLILEGFREIASNWLITAGGFVFLLFVATTLFQVIRNSLNEIWGISVPGNGTLFKFRSRLKALVVIVSAGILFLLVVSLEGLQAFISDEFQKSSPLLNVLLNRFISVFVSVFVATAWFTMIFCYLPDGRPSLRTGMIGALVTAVLFTIGKIVVRWALYQSNLNSIFGASASMVLLLLFVFYSSFIFYFGAAFTKVFAASVNQPIQPAAHAVKVHVEEE